MSLAKWAFLALLGMILAVAVYSSANLAGTSGTAQVNISTIFSGGANVTSDSVYGTMLLGDPLGGVSSSNDERFGLLFTWNRTFPAAQISITVYAYNGSDYVSDFNISFACRFGQNDCEPTTQNSTPVGSFNRGVYNVTASGSGFSQVLYSLNTTCSGINITFTNSSNVSAFPKQTLTTSGKLLYGSLEAGESFDYFLFANVSGNPLPGSCSLDNEYEVT